MAKHIIQKVPLNAWRLLAMSAPYYYNLSAVNFLHYTGYLTINMFEFFVYHCAMFNVCVYACGFSCCFLLPEMANKVEYKTVSL